MASVALHAGELKIETALEAYDKGNFELARSLVTRMLRSGRLPRSKYGGPLFVLGAVKANDAEQQAVPQRRRIEYQIASRYLTEARVYGFPAPREAAGNFMLGQSLIESGQFDEGIRVLNDLDRDPKVTDQSIKLKTKQLLAATCLVMPHPKLEDALRNNESVLKTKNLSNEQHVTALIQRAECLSRLGRFDEARESLGKVPPSQPTAAEVALMSGRISLDEVEAALQKVSASDRSQAVAAMAERITAALKTLQKASALDEQKVRIVQQSYYQSGRGLALKGDLDGALKQFPRTRQLFGDSYEGLAASLGEANAWRKKEEFDDALLAYRRVLETFADIPVYRSHVLPVERIRDEMMAAHNDLLERDRFNDALTLLNYFTPLFTRTEQLELRGDTLERWGNRLVSQATDDATAPAIDKGAGSRTSASRRHCI